MSDRILHRGATVLCSHGGIATPQSTFPRVTVSGQDVITMANLYSIAGCPNDPPCALGFWASGATRVTAGGVPVVVFSSSSTCIPTGNPMSPKMAHTRVRAT